MSYKKIFGWSIVAITTIFGFYNITWGLIILSLIIFSILILFKTSELNIQNNNLQKAANIFCILIGFIFSLVTLIVWNLEQFILNSLRIILKLESIGINNILDLLVSVFNILSVLLVCIFGILFYKVFKTPIIVIVLSAAFVAIILVPISSLARHGIIFKDHIYKLNSQNISKCDDFEIYIEKAVDVDYVGGNKVYLHIDDPVFIIKNDRFLNAGILVSRGWGSIEKIDDEVEFDFRNNDPLITDQDMIKLESCFKNEISGSKLKILYPYKQ